jgi:hypothetical protein
MALAELYTLPVRVGGAGPVRVISGSLTAATDETVYTPTSSNNCVFLVGQYFSESNATNVTYKSGSETLNTGEFAANQGVYDKVQAGFILATEAGQALKINPSVDISSAIFHVIEAPALVF